MIYSNFLIRMPLKLNLFYTKLKKMSDLSELNLLLTCACFEEKNIILKIAAKLFTDWVIKRNRVKIGKV